MGFFWQTKRTTTFSKKNHFVQNGKNGTLLCGGRLEGVVIRMHGGKLEVVVVDLKLLA